MIPSEIQNKPPMQEGNKDKHISQAHSHMHFAAVRATTIAL
jgi:hypothetical protein